MKMDETAEREHRMRKKFDQEYNNCEKYQDWKGLRGENDPVENIEEDQLLD